LSIDKLQVFLKYWKGLLWWSASVSNSCIRRNTFSIGISVCVWIRK